MLVLKNAWLIDGIGRATVSDRLRGAPFFLGHEAVGRVESNLD